MLEPINEPHFSAHCAMHVEIMALCMVLQCIVHVRCDLTGGAAWAHVIGGTRHWVRMEPLFYNSTCVSYNNTHYNLYIYHNRSRDHYDKSCCELAIIHYRL